MGSHLFAGVTALALFTSPLAFSRTEAPARPETSAQSPQSPATGGARGGGRGDSIQGNGGAEPCTNSPICAWGRERDLISHEVHTPDMAFTYAYPFALPDGGGGVSAVALN